MAEIGSAFISLMPSAAGFQGKLDKQITPGINSVGKKAGIGFGKAFGAVAALGIGAKVVGFLGDSIGEAREAQKVGAQTTNVLKSMGLQSTVTANQIGAYATKLSLATGIDDELIQTSENTLLTFGNLAKSAGVTGGAFQRASGLALDMSVALGTDLKGATVQIGKALNDPIKGITALSRSGVSFTEQQKETIKSLVTGGQVAKAQGLILNELGKEFKGSAAAQATAGEKAAVAFDNLKEQVGTALLPVFDRLANLATTKVIPAISSFITGLQSGSGAGGFFAKAIDTLGPVFSRVVSAATAFVGYYRSQVLPAIRDALLPVVAKTREAFDNLTDAYKRNKPQIDQLIGAAKTVANVYYTKVLPAILAVSANAIPKIINAFSKAVSVAAFFVRAFNTVKSAAYSFGFAIGQVAVSVGKFVAAVREKVRAVTQFVKGIPDKITGFFSDLPGAMETIGGQIIEGLKRGISSAAHFVFEAVDRIVSAIPLKIRKLMGIASPSKVTTILGQYISDGLAKGIENGSTKVTKAVGKVLEKAKAKLEERISDFRSLSDSVGSNITGNLFSGLDTASAFTANLGTVKGNLGAALADFNTLKGFGLNGKFLAQLFADGGFPLIHSLAADPGQAVAAGSLFGDIQNLSSQLGGAVATSTPDIGGGATLAELLAVQKETNRLLKKVPSETGAHVGGAVNGAAARGKRNGNRGKRKL